MGLQLTIKVFVVNPKVSARATCVRRGGSYDSDRYDRRVCRSWNAKGEARWRYHR